VRGEWKDLGNVHLAIAGKGELGMAGVSDSDGDEYQFHGEAILV
jgi:hypothetical protein